MTSMGSALNKAGIASLDDAKRKADEKAAKKAANEAAKKASAGATAVTGQQPAEKTVLERMRKGEIVPVEQLIEARDAIAAAIEREEQERRAEIAEGKQLFAELQQLHTEFAPLLAGGSGETKKLLRQQMNARLDAIAAKRDVKRGRLLAAVEAIEAAERGKHFGDLGRVLRDACSSGFLRRLSEAEHQAEVESGRGHLVFRARGDHFGPQGYERDWMTRQVVWAIRKLFVRACDEAARERPEQWRILNSGPFPSTSELDTLLMPGTTIEGERTFGCVLVGYGLMDPRTQRIRRSNGIVSLTILMHEGVKCIRVNGVLGSASNALPVGQPAPIAAKRKDTEAWVFNLCQHLVTIVVWASMTDAEVAEQNEKFRVAKRFDELIPVAESTRKSFLADLTGDTWRVRNSKWLAQHGGGAKPKRVRKPRTKKDEGADASGGNGTTGPAEPAPDASGAPTP